MKGLGGSRPVLGDFECWEASLHSTTHVRLMSVGDVTGDSSSHQVSDIRGIS